MKENEMIRTACETETWNGWLKLACKLFEFMQSFENLFFGLPFDSG
jgi:hypothetical protein